MAIGGILLIFVLIVYKNVYSAIRALDLSTAVAILKNPAIYSDLLDIGEFRINLSVYNYIVNTEFHIPMVDSLARVLSIIPFFNNLFPTTIPIRFSTIIQNNFFSSSYGLASCFWAELYAMGGTIFLAVVTIIWAFLMKFASRKLNRGLTNSTPFLVTVISYCGFYIHRLDWIQMYGCVKSVVLFYIAWWIVNNIFSRGTQR